MLISSGSQFDLKVSSGDKMIADDDYFYIYKFNDKKGFNSGIYKMS
jgi:hypothetical protein